MQEMISVVEFEKIFTDKISEESFELLCALSHNDNASQVLEHRNNSIRFLSYAGVLQLKNSQYIEILPKTHKNDPETGRKVFLKMFKKINCNYYKSLTNMSVDISKLPLLDIFIILFLNELDELLKIGIRKNYQKINENSIFIRGKIKIKETIKYNYAHKERTFIEYNKLNEDTPENIILNSCIHFLYNKIENKELQQRFRKLFELFDNISMHQNPIMLFSKININRLNSYYEPCLELAKIFLTGNSFLPQKGSINSFSLLFPLNRLFEDYVFAHIKENFKNIFPSIKAQSNPYYLLDEPGMFKLKPDIVLKNNEKILILDTKWKLLDTNNEKEKYNISQNDLYQLYAYGKKYLEKDITKKQRKVELYLIYPQTETFNKKITWKFDESLPITMLPFDLETDDFVLNITT